MSAYDNEATKKIIKLDWKNATIDDVKKLLEKGANPNAKSCDEYEYTPLIIASAGGYTNIALMLVDRGANIDTSSKNGYGAISIAASNGHMDTAMALSAKKMPMYGMYRIKHKDSVISEDTSFVRV